MFRLRNRKQCFELCLKWKRGVHRNHYDSLGITPKASQADIKKAYYKLSMKFHPDKPEGSENKFREITAAYEVLSNLKLRRLYDQGIFRGPRGDFEEVPNPDDVPHDTRVRPRSYTPATGRTNVYDFDEWSRMHYTKTIKREFNSRERLSRKKAYQEEKKQETEESWLFLVCVAALVSLIPIFWVQDPDKPSKKKPPDER